MEPESIAEEKNGGIKKIIGNDLDPCTNTIMIIIIGSSNSGTLLGKLASSNVTPIGSVAMMISYTLYRPPLGRQHLTSPAVTKSGLVYLTDQYLFYFTLL